jgi:hypothetical protein
MAKIPTKILLHTLGNAQHSCAINYSSKISVIPQKKDTDVYNYASVLDFHWPSGIEYQRLPVQNFQKKLVLTFIHLLIPIKCLQTKSVLIKFM